MEDSEVIREVWEGRIPVCFNLAKQELFGADTPDPYFFLLARGSYLPLIYDQLKRHFSHFVEAADDDKQELWLESGDQPLKWHYPIGVLYDLYGAGQLPWRLTVHLRDFPDEELLRCGGRDGVESMFMSTVKEADALKHKGEVINAMQKREHRQLWTGLVSDKLDVFWSQNSRLMSDDSEVGFRAVPVRVYRAGFHYMQPFMRPFAESDQRPLVLCDLLDVLRAADSSISEEARLVCHGVTLPTDSVLLWLSRHLSHPDNFLHLVLTQP